MKIKNKNSLRGFSLIEIMTVVAIVSIFSSFLFISFRGNEKFRDLRNAGLLVADGIKRAQTMALAGATVNGAAPVSYSFGAGDCSANCHYQLSAKFSDDSTSLIEQVNLSPNISVHLNNDLTVSFLPPRGDAKIYAGVLPALSASVRLEYNNSAVAPVCVEVNSVSGRVDIKNCP